MKMYLFAIVAALSLFATSASATDFSADGGGYVEGSYQTGEFSGYAESTTTGGSMAQGTVSGDGYAVSGTANAGGGHAYAGAAFGASGLDVYSGGESYSVNLSGSFDGGNGFAETAGGVGTDYTSHAEGSFSGFGGSANLDFSAWADFNW